MTHIALRGADGRALTMSLGRNLGAQRDSPIGDLSASLSRARKRSCCRAGGA